MEKEERHRWRQIKTKKLKRENIKRANGGRGRGNRKGVIPLLGGSSENRIIELKNRQMFHIKLDIRVEKFQRNNF